MGGTSLHHARSNRSNIGVVALFALALSLPSLLALGHIADGPIRPPDDGGGGDGLPQPPPPREAYLMFGPVEGFTTASHRATEPLALPLFSRVPFSVGGITAAHTVSWEGLQPVHVERNGAIFQLSRPGTITLTAVVHPGGVRLRCNVEVKKLKPRGVPFDYDVLPDRPFELTEGASNAQAVDAYFGAPIGQLKEIEEGVLATSIGRTLVLTARPKGQRETGQSMSLLEWRIDGRARGLGRVPFFTGERPGRHTISVGPPECAKTFDLVTYSVSIRSDYPEGRIPQGRPVTFSASTDPAGLEGLVTWLAATKFGSGEPTLGEGRVFTTMFTDTFGPLGDGTNAWQWMGVRADNARLGQDTKIPVPPAAPSELEITSISSSEISLSWADMSNTESGFAIQSASTTGGPWLTAGTLQANATAFTHPGLPSASSRYYRVRAFNDGGNSAFSNVAGATTAPGGGCCNPNGTCFVSEGPACIASGGLFGGVGSICPEVPCIGTVPAQLRLYQTVTPTVDATYATNLASSLFGLTGTVNDENDAIKVTRTGSDEYIAVYKASGGFLYENPDKLYSPLYQAGSLTEQQAIQFATDFLNQHGLFPAQAAFLEAALIDAKDLQSDSSVPNHWQIRFGFQVDARQGLGAPMLVPMLGAEIDVRVGNVEIIGLNWAWRDLAAGGVAQTYDVSTAAGIANQAEGFTPELPIAPLVMYNAQSPTEIQKVIQPRYIIATRLEGDHGGGINIGASGLAPRVSVVSSAGTTFQEGQLITLTANILGGTAPFQTVWLDPMGVNASRGGNPALPLSQQNPATFRLSHGNHLVEVIVTDANGLRADGGIILSILQDPNPPPASGGIACPPQSPHILREVVNGNGWTTVARITEHDGMQLNNLRFTQKLLAREVSVPYYKLETTLMPLTNCELRYPTPATGNCRSILMEPGIVKEVNPWFTMISACYCVDHIPDGPVELSGIMYMCQEYLFKPKTTGCGPSDWGECAPYASYINYTYEPPPLAPNNILRQINTFHRFDYDVVTSSNIGGFFKDRDDLFVYWPRVVSSVTEEQSALMANFGSPGDKDNYHQTDDTSIRIPGCSGLTPISGVPGLGGGDWECNHIHYRWSAAFGAKWGGGNVFPGSAQRVRNWVFRRRRTEGDPPSFDLGQFLCRPGMSPPCDPETFESLLGSDLVFWEDVHGYLQADSFTSAHRFFR